MAEALCATTPLRTGPEWGYIYNLKIIKSNAKKQYGGTPMGRILRVTTCQYVVMSPCVSVCVSRMLIYRTKP